MSLVIQADFRIQGNSTRFVRSGFSHPEATHTWALHPYSEIVLPGLGGAGSGFVLIRLDGAYFHPPTGRGLRIIISVSGQQVVDEYVCRAGFIGFEIPDALSSSSAVHLTVEYPEATHPRSAGHAEGRYITARFASLWLFKGPTRDAGVPRSAEELQLRGAAEGFGAPRAEDKIWWAPSARMQRSLGRTGSLSVVIVGNCLAGLIVSGLSPVPETKLRYSFHDIPLHLQKLSDPPATELLSRADWIFVQGIAQGDFDRLRLPIRPGCRVLSYPNLVLRGLWPFDAGEGPRELAEVRKAAGFIHVDRALERLRVLEPLKANRVQRYLELDFGLDADARRVLETQERFFRDVDAATGTELGSFISSRFRYWQLFYDSVHPTGILGAELCRFVLQKLGVDGRDLQFGGMDGAGGYALPVHPGIARLAGLTWAAPETRFQYGRLGPVTWREWAETYVELFG